MEYKVIIVGIRTYRNILIKIILTYGRQPINDFPQRVFKASLKFLIKRSFINWQMYMRSIRWQAMPKVKKKSDKQRQRLDKKFVKEMRGRQMRIRYKYKQNMRWKNRAYRVWYLEYPRVDVQGGNNNLVFCCYICICCLKLHQALITMLSFYKGGYLDLVGEHCTQLQCIYVFTICCRILISRPPRVFRRFKRRSCLVVRVNSVRDGRCLIKHTTPSNIGSATSVFD